MTSTEFSNDDKAVSPVIGVILMVAIVVILAAVIGTFVLDLGSSVNQDVQAAATIEFDESSDEVRVTFTSAQESDTVLNVTAKNLSGSNSEEVQLTKIGDSHTFSTIDGTSVKDGDRIQITVVAINQERETVVQTKTDTV